MQQRLAAGVALMWLFVASAVGAQTRVPEQRFFLSVDGGGQTGSQLLQDRGEIGVLFGEALVLETNYGIERSGESFRTSATVRLLGGFGVGVGYIRTTAIGTGDTTVLVPHPIFLNRPRAATKAVTALGHRESMVHLHGAWIVQLNERVHIQFFGGPSLMHLEQAIVTNAVLGAEVFPYEVVELLGVSGMEVEESGVGFNGGADFAFMIAPYWGIGGFVQYAGGKLDLQMLEEPTSITLGGFQFGAGIRLKY